MENWGLITYSEFYLCVDQQTSSAAGAYDVASVISHEQAHQVRQFCRQMLFDLELSNVRSES